MRTNISSLVVAAALGIVAQQAAAVVTFAFDDNPDPNGQFIYTAPVAFGQFGSLVYNSQVPVDLDVDPTGEGGTEYSYTDATFQFSAAVGALTAGPFPGSYFAPLIGGSLAFTSAGGDLLFFGTFGDQLPAVLQVVVNTGSINVSLEVGGLNYVPGQTLLDDLSANIGTQVLGFTPPFDGVWTLSNLPILQTVVPPPPDGQAAEIFLADFVANSSYSGTTGISMVPAPGAIGLAGLGAVGLGFRRRR